jgi:hypothetical protein
VRDGFNGDPLLQVLAASSWPNIGIPSKHHHSSLVEQAMSADLFASFGADPPSNQAQQQVSAQRSAPAVSRFSFFDDLNSTPAAFAPPQQPPSTSNIQDSGAAPFQAPAVDDNDDWGDFEGGSSFEPAPTAKSDPFAFASPNASQPSLTSWNINPNTQDPFAFGTEPASRSTQQTWQRAPIVKAKKSADPSLLFDAEDDFGDDDEFGEFEGEQEPKVAPKVPAASAAPASALVNLLGDMSVSQPQSYTTSTRETAAHKASKQPTSAKKSSSGRLGKVSKPKQQPLAPTPPVQKDDDDWDEFDDWEASIPTKTPTKASSTLKPVQTAISEDTSMAPAPILPPTPADPQPGELPPTNVPPPGVLLSLFPTLFAEAQEKLFKPMAAQPLPMRNKLMAEPATIAYLQGYLILANVAAHVIAGRKLRWKRDQHLSQGMRIGPASSRATSGMKLTGIDKGENMKEEREVSDVVRHWKEQVGRLRHVVSGVNQIKTGTLDRGPDLQEMMPVKTLKQSEGGIPARTPCMLCGLKREERVTAADMATDDSFGEWWIDQVSMHRGMFPLISQGL